MGNLQELVSDQLLPYVSTPGQYVGGEINQLPKSGDWEAAKVRVAVAFPDAYTIGMSHLGCQIIYWLCNHTEDVTAERVYCPWVDAEDVMRKKNIPLFTWDTRRSVSEVDILAISLQYEMGFTNILTLLDLANIPLRSVDRDDSHPLVIAGGPQSDNPEPVAEFIDIVVLGDGEESMAAILSAYKEYKANGVRRREMIRLMAKRFPWAYVPALYDVAYNNDNTIRSVSPREEGLPEAIVRCQTPDFGNAPFPVRPLVPHVRVVQDRISIEIMRGCPQRCRFCHAGYTKRPIGRRTVDEILNIAEEAYRATGHTEIGLLSLSTADYPYLPELAERIDKQFTHRQVSISVPSMRVDKMLSNIPWMVSSVRKSGLTIAVEAARDDMRAAIRKVVTDGNLIDGVTQAYQAGWKSVKLYFMTGFPGERPDDIDGIMDISREVSRARIPVSGHPAAVNSAVGWLVPKPHTPFQWAAQPKAEYFHEVRRRLRMMERSRKSAVRIKMHNVERSVLEAVFSRGDRKLGPVIERAWRDGARFDGWDEQFDNRIWDRAFEAEGVDPAWYAHRERPNGEVFPWSHLAGGNSEGYLKDQYDDVFVQIGADGPGLSLVPAAAG
ncbi:MAG: B12-binding domain-containing radical SAM protein [Phycisphaerae bacterium]|nr:MAG: B12-binding domain-containing radical SAM protein [Phycisphaerae bacterium]